MSYGAWGDGDDVPDGYVTAERALEMVEDALEEAANICDAFRELCANAIRAFAKRQDASKS
jgi:hypothetical protein